MISCLFIMCKGDEKNQLRERFRFRVAFSLLVFAGLMLLMLRAGQTAGTPLVKDINVLGSSNPQFLTAVDGTLYFSATDAVNGTELWKSDGTAAVTENENNTPNGGCFIATAVHALSSGGSRHDRKIITCHPISDLLEWHHATTIPDRRPRGAAPCADQRHREEEDLPGRCGQGELP